MSKIQFYDVIKRPLMTEKSSMYEEAGATVYLFEVAIKSTKDVIKQAVEALFDVHVKAVNTVIVRGKSKRVGKVLGKRSNWKKAYVTLKEGDSINFVDGM
ncbi:50S ribosomal protein L23 [bacterium]|nr:50S ribosomal protein L23 [bacterium]